MPAAPSLLWFADRSSYEDAIQFCPRARHLAKHAGSTGYGLARKGTKIPLVTGNAYHAGLAPALDWCLKHPGEGIPPDEVIRTGIAAALTKYRQTIEARGFAYLEGDETVTEITREQEYLVEGMIWGWLLEVLPEVLSRGIIVEVEHDGVLVVACTCGLGDGILAQEDHDARGCQGIGWQTKPDFLLLTPSGELEYHEFKGTGQDQPTFRDKWEVMIQMITATTSAELRWGKPVVAIYVHGLIKGKREQDYNWESGRKDSGNFKQQSVACYGYYRPAEPPVQEADIKPQYKNWDDYEQKEKQVSKKHKKTPIWEIPLPVPEGWTVEEAWSEYIGPEVRKKMLAIVGPLSKQQSMVEGFFREARGEEDRWQHGLWDLYTRWAEGSAEEGFDYWQDVWATPEFQARLDQHFPRSYACRRFGARHKCQYEDICFGREGWAHPLTVSFEDPGQGQYILRRPHHQAELEQAIARGLLPPAEGLAEEQPEVGDGW